MNRWAAGALGMAAAGLAAAGWGVVGACLGLHGATLDSWPIILVSAGVLWTLVGWWTARRHQGAWVAVPWGGLLAAWLLWTWGSEVRMGFREESLLWIGVGVLGLTLASAVDLHRRRSEDAGPPRRWVPWTGAAAGVVALALVGQLVLGHADPLTVRLASPVAEVPELPREVVGEPLWVAEIEGYWRDQAAGLRGPVVALRDGVVGLNSADGSVAWERRRDGALLCEWHQAASPGDDLPELRGAYLLASPNRRYVAYALCGAQRQGGGRYEVLDTMTGELVLQGTFESSPFGQLTDRVLWLDRTGIDLESGRVLWEETARTSLPATSSRFVELLRCTGQVCGVVTYSDQDPAEERAFEGVLVPGPGRLLSAQGWVVQLAPGVTGLERDADVAIQALNLETGEAVPLGEFWRVESVSKTLLVLRRADHSRAAFDPITRAVVELDEQAWHAPADEDWPIPSVSAPGWEPSNFSKHARQLRVMVDGQERLIPVDVPAGVAQHYPNVHDFAVRAWSAPGCVIVQGQVFPFVAAGEGIETRTYLACLPSRAPG